MWVSELPRQAKGQSLAGHSDGWVITPDNGYMPLAKLFRKSLAN